MKSSLILLFTSLVAAVPTNTTLLTSSDRVKGSAAFQAAVALESEETVFQSDRIAENEASIAKIHNVYRNSIKEVLTSRGPHAVCNADNVHVRREW